MSVHIIMGMYSFSIECQIGGDLKDYLGQSFFAKAQLMTQHSDLPILKSCEIQYFSREVFPMAVGSQCEKFPSCPIGISPGATCANCPLSVPCDSMEEESLSGLCLCSSSSNAINK